jgi:hypothetical protein
MKQISNRIKERSREFKQEVRERTLGYIIASFGLVAGLAWNEAIKALIEAFFPLQKDTLKAKFVYAIIITLIVVFVSLYFTKFFKDKKEETEKS